MSFPGEDQLLQQAIAHHQSGRFAEAEGLYQRILATNPNHVDALHFLGVLAGQFNKNEAAIDLIRNALRLRPDYIEARFNLATNLIALGRTGEAILEFEHVLQAQADDADGHFLIADLLRQVSRKEDAIAHLRRTIELRESNPDAYNNLGNLVQERGELDEAIRCFKRSLELRPGNAHTLNNLGNALRMKGDSAEALKLLRQAVAADPAPQIRTNLANVMADQGELDAAIHEYRIALKAAHDYAEGWNNLGVALRRAGRVQDTALLSHRQALSLRPDFPEARYAEAWALLLRGDFEAGWQAYESRRLAAPGWARFPNPWKGEPLGGRRILLHSEQGFGDTIQFSRFASVITGLGGRVILECQRELASLMTGLAGVEEIISPGDPPPQFDFHCPLMSVPRLLSLKENSIPSRVPYIDANPIQIAQWAQRLDDPDRRPRVGLVWAGRSNYSNDRNRSMRLADLAPLARIQHIHLHSLQTGEPGAEIDQAPPGLQILDHRYQIQDFSDTAALIANLDLVISVDTAVAHLAGAMGKSVWTLLPFAPDWRWMLDRTDSPWYPTMRLFRQRRIGDWNDIIADVVAALAERYPEPLRASDKSASPA